MGTWWTPAAFNTSKKTPSLVLALPIVPHAISLPLIEKFFEFLKSKFLYNFEA